MNDKSRWIGWLIGALVAVATAWVIGASVADGRPLPETKEARFERMVQERLERMRVEEAARRRYVCEAFKIRDCK